MYNIKYKTIIIKVAAENSTEKLFEKKISEITENNFFNLISKESKIILENYFC